MSYLRRISVGLLIVGGTIIVWSGKSTVGAAILITGSLGLVISTFVSKKS